MGRDTRLLRRAVRTRRIVRGKVAEQTIDSRAAITESGGLVPDRIADKPTSRRIVDRPPQGWILDTRCSESENERERVERGERRGH